jgi:protein ImuB
MPRIMTIWLPRWPVQRRLLERPEWRAVPVFVCRRERRGVMAVVSWAWAEPPRAAGRRSAGRRPRIPQGMSLAEAMAVLSLAHGSRACHVAEVVHDDPVADRAALDQLGRWCRRFSPTVGILDDADWGAAECIHLDVTGTANFFGGESALVRTAVWTLASRGVHARAAIADTCAAAWAAARHTDLLPDPVDMTTGRASQPPRKRRWAVVPAGAQRLKSGPTAPLSGLPLPALRLDQATLGMLGELGIDTIGGALRLPAAALASRFPPLLARRLAQFTGAVAEPLAAPRGEELPQATQAFDVPLAGRDEIRQTLEDVIDRLVTACVAPLAAQGKGVQALQVRLEQAAVASAATAAPIVIDVGLFRPSISVRHLVDLVRLRLERVRLAGDIEGVAVEVVAAGIVACRQRSLFETDDVGDGAGIEPLLDRLSSRLGRAAVFEPKGVADAQPEQAWIAVPPGMGPVRTSGRDAGGVATVGPTAAGRTVPRPGDLPRDRVRQAGVTPRPAAGRRPIWLLPRPVLLEPLRAGVVAIAPDGPPLRFRLGDEVHAIVQAHGPERIETAWWRGPTVRRDYYVVETQSGGRFWLFRRLRDGNWFLHGTFA